MNGSMKKISLMILSLACVSLAGCGDDWGLFTTNPKKTPYEPPKEGEENVVVGKISKESFRPALDILFVIDDSASMDPHQKNLSSNITLFTDAIVKTKFLDYHIGVITSSMTSYSGYYSPYYSTPTNAQCCGKLSGTPPFVDRNTANGIHLLAQNLLVGTGGDASEKFFEPVTLAFTAPLINTHNANFLRQDASLAVIFITDTDDQSNQYNYTPVTFYDFLKQLKGGAAEKVFIGAAYVPDGEYSSCGGEYEIQSMDRLPQFFNLTGAMAFSLCDPQYGTKLSEIGKLLASKAQTMYLEQFPEAGTISVMIGTEELPNDPKKGWTYNPEKNALEFGTDIEWDKYPDNTFPVVSFKNIPIE